jgi:hypothetical protein
LDLENNMHLAQSLDSIQSAGLPGFKLGSNFGDLVNNSQIFNYIFSFAGLALLTYLLWGGLQMMVSRGDPKALEMAKTKITSALTGFFIIFLSYSIIKLIGMILGLTVFSTIFK